MGKQSNIARTIDATPVRLENGRWVFRQCRAKLHEERANTRNLTEFNRKTIGDIVQKHKERQRILSIVRGDK